MCLGVPGRVVEILDAEQSLAQVDISGVKRAVNIACVLGEGEAAQSCIGAWVLVHVGFAMSRIDEEEAEHTLRLLRELGELQQELDQA